MENITRKDMSNDLINKNEKRLFWCFKHQCFHKYLHNGKPSKTYQKCLYSNNFAFFKENVDNSTLFKLTFKKNWNQDNANYYKGVNEN